MNFFAAIIQLLSLRACKETGTVKCFQAVQASGQDKVNFWCRNIIHHFQNVSASSCERSLGLQQDSFAELAWYVVNGSMPVIRAERCYQFSFIFTMLNQIIRQSI